MDLEKAAQAVTKKTKAVIILHYAGVPCDMDKIVDLCDKHNIKLIEDEVTERLEWDSFENYHKWYGDEQTDHGDSVLPIIIDFDDEELIIDGWHRFHSYVRKGLNKVPVLGIYRD